MNVGALAKFALGQAAGVAYRTGLGAVAQFVRDSGRAQRAALALRDEDTQRFLLADRVQTMVAEVAQALHGANRLTKAEAAARFNAHQNELIEAARAHAELLQWEAFTEALAEMSDPGTKKVLTWLRDLFGLSLIEKHLAWYLMNGRLSMQRGRTVGEYINRLLAKLRPHALDLVEAFGYGPEHLRAAIALGAEAERQAEAADYYAAQRASGSAPKLEKHTKPSPRNVRS
jgi:acyl-CoA oxidase